MIFGLSFLSASPVFAEKGHSKPVDSAQPRLKQVFTKETLMKTQVKKDNKVSVFIEFKAMPLAAFAIQYTRINGKPPTPEEQKRYAAKLESNQQAFMGYLKGLNAQHLSNFRVSANGVKCQILKSQIDEIKNHESVKNVSIVQTRTKQNTANNPRVLNEAGVLTDLGLSGKGITIAIVGTGINYQLETFGGKYSFDDSNKIINDPNIIEPGTFPTAKIIGGIDLAGANYDSDDEDNNVPQEDADPYEPFFSHETLVAAIAAGMPVEDRVPAGVAPDAKLIAIKIFGDGGATTELVADAIEYALDPNRDGSMDDKVDVINLSVSSSFGKPDDVDTIAAKSAIAMGVVVVASVGNEGNNPFIAASPSVADTAISVGSHASATLSEDNNPFTPTSLIFHLGFDVNGEHVFYPARALTRFSNNLSEAFSANVVMANPINTCEPLTQDVTGKVVVFRYMNCPGFTNEQEDLAEDAGALASIQIEDNNDTLGIAIASIPAYRIYKTHGEQLLKALSKNPELELTFDSANIMLNTSQDFKVSEFSSRGPSFGAGYFKPDLIGPGENITAGDAPFADSGTSFSAPFVAGVAAVLLQQNPNLTPADVKAILQNSTTPARTLNTSSAPFYPLSLQGVGRVQVDKSLQLSALASPGGLSFGVLNPAQKQFEARTLTLKNFSHKHRYFKVTVEAGQKNRGVELRVPREVHIAPNSVKELTIRLVADPRKLTNDINANSLIEADGWIVFSDEDDTLRVGYAAAVEPASQVSLVKSDTKNVVLKNTGVVGSTLESYSYVQFIDDEEVQEEARATYPADAGYRVKKLDDGNVELNMVFVFDEPIPTLMDKLRFINFFLPVEDDEYEVLSMSIHAERFLEETEPFIHQAKFDVEEDSGNFYLGGSVEFDFNKRWVKVQLIIADTGNTIFGGNPLFAFYFEPNRGLFRTGFDIQDQAMLAKEKAYIAPKRTLKIKALRQSESEGGFILVHKNTNQSEIIDF